jgi:hypothetical protein
LDTRDPTARRRGALRRVALHAVAWCAALLASGGAAAIPGSLDAPIALELPAQPLGESLRGLAKQGDLQILFEASLVAGRDGREIRGRLSAREALDALLRDSGLEAYEQAPGVVVIRRRSGEPRSHEAASIDPVPVVNPAREVRP